MIFFPITSAFYDGLRHTPRHWLDLAKTMNGSKWQILWRIRWPSALPSLATGLRVATAIAPIGAIVGEWVGSSRGLGYLMLKASQEISVVVCHHVGDLLFPMLESVCKSKNGYTEKTSGLL